MDILRWLLATMLLVSVVWYWLYKFRMFVRWPLLFPVVRSIAALYFAFWVVVEKPGFRTIIWLYFLGGIFFGRTANTIFTRLELQYVQLWRDFRADAIFKSGTNKQFVLYLRPTSQVTNQLSLTGVLPKWGGIDFESLIEDVVSLYGRLVGLGTPGESIGAGRIMSEISHGVSSFLGWLRRLTLSS